ncbi:DUF5990 family protein [Streptomyces sp. NBC_00122]|uniref:DUF5990 family protein n=1 Tax=Streptomyces sp. NBC_00122 TaxID=2903623 RepID=UPI0038701DA0
MARRHEGETRQRRNVERLRVLAVHQVTGPAQPDEILKIHTTTIPQRRAPPVKSAKVLPAPDGGRTGDDGPVQIRIEAFDLPGRTCAAGPGFPGYADVHVAVQLRSPRGELLGPQPGDASAVSWTLECDVATTPHGLRLQGASPGPGHRPQRRTVRTPARPARPDRRQGAAPVCRR